jgi:LmbE family N-acetylglucosaminyl deacetylase
MNFDPLLILAPHTDDAELGCGATIAYLLEAGIRVYVAVFSTAEASLPAGVPTGELKKEFFEAMVALGIPQDHLFIYDYPVRCLSSYRQDVLERLVQLRREIQPSAVFLPASSDLHQDHQVVHVEGLRAFKDITVWGYELPWNHVTFSANAFMVVERRHLEKKWKALQAYKTQFILGRPYFSWDFIEGLARVRGTQVKSEYGEAYEVIRVKVDLR